MRFQSFPRYGPYSGRCEVGCLSAVRLGGRMDYVRGALSRLFTVTTPLDGCISPTTSLRGPVSPFVLPSEFCGRSSLLGTRRQRARRICISRTRDLWLSASKWPTGSTRASFTPPVLIDALGSQDSLSVPSGFFLTVARGRGYKNVRELVGAFSAMPESTLVIVGDVQSDQLPANVISVGRVTDSELRWLYSNAQAMVSVSREDFGLTTIEANAFGTPALVLRAGGFLDTVREHVTGEFIDDTTVDSIRAAVRAFPSLWDKGVIRNHAVAFSPEAFVERLFEVIATRDNAPQFGGRLTSA